MPKTRLDLLLVERGLAELRAKAQALIMAGQVRVQGQVVIKPATSVDPASQLEVEQGPRFVSRGGEKLEAAMEAFGLDVNGLVCADVGASTGGFTDCLLQHGAARVYAIDVGKGIVALEIAQRSARGYYGRDQCTLCRNASGAGITGDHRCFIYIPEDSAAGYQEMVPLC